MALLHAREVWLIFVNNVLCPDVYSYIFTAVNDKSNGIVDFVWYWRTFMLGGSFVTRA